MVPSGVATSMVRNATLKEVAVAAIHSTEPK